MPAATWADDRLTPLLPWQEEAALAALHDPSAAVQQAALAWLTDKQLTSEPLVDEAARHLGPGEPPAAREHAAKILEHRGAKAARFAGQLMAMLGEPVPEVRDAAAHALNALGAAAGPSAPALGERLKDPDPQNRVIAMTLLARMPAEAAPFAPQIAAS